MAEKKTACWVRQSLADRYKLTAGEWEIHAIALGFSETRSYYVLKHNGKTIDEFDRLSEAKLATQWAK